MKIKIADTAWSKFSGLMLRSNPEPVLFVFKKPARHSFHTWFMRFPIDFVFFDEKMNVLELHENVKPWRFVKPEQPCRYVLELAAGTASKQNELVILCRRCIDSQKVP